MPETNKRDYTGQSKKTSVTPQGRKSVGGGAKYPKVPSSKDGQYEGTAAGKTKLGKF